MATLVTLTNCKEHVRRTDTAEDTVITAYRAAAIQWVENYTGHLLTQREVVDAFHEWGEYLTLRHQPITVGDPTPTLTVEYIDEEGAEAEYEAYDLRDEIYPWIIQPPFGDEFPTLGVNGNVTVTYTAGYEAGEVPDALNQAVLLLVGHWYSMRSAVGEGSFMEPPLAVTSLCRPYRGAVLA